MNKCEYCTDGVCEYYGTYEQQLENGVEWDCNGTEEEQKECGMQERKSTQ